MILLHHWYLSLPALGSVGGFVGWVIRRYRRSAGRELQPFRDYILGSIRLSVGSRFSQLLAAQFGIRQYAERVLATFPRDLLVPGAHTFKLPINRTYIRLSLRTAPQRRIQDKTLLSKEGIVLVLGEPGSGKSSLTRKLFREACESAYVHPFRARLPVHLELKRLTWSDMPSADAEGAQWIVNAVQDCVLSVRGVHDPVFLYEAFSFNPGLVVFLDGLDEIPSRYLKPAVAAVAGGAKALREMSASTTIILTARTQLRGSLPRDFIDCLTDIFSLEPFSAADMFAFLRRWPFPPAHRLAEAERIFRKLRSNPTLFDMCANPLVLSMYVGQDQRHIENSSPARLPDTRADFYREVTKELLFFRRQDQLGPSEAGSQILRNREQLIGLIALDHLVVSDDPANSLSLRRAATIAKNHLGLQSDADAREAVIQLGVDTGIFTEERPQESLQFIHLTLCEFMAAMELAQQADKTFVGLLRRLLGDGDAAARLPGQPRRLWETVTFAISLSPRVRRLSSLDRLVQLGAPDELILRTVREAQAYDHLAFSQVLDRVTASLLERSVDHWDSEWFQQVRLVLSCLSEAQRLSMTLVGQVQLPSNINWLRRLSADDGARLERIFDLYLAAAPSEALHMADEYGIASHIFSDGERIVAALEQLDLVALAIDRIRQDPVRNSDWIRYLAEAGLRHELVAQTLADEALPTELPPAGTTIPKEYSWHKVGQITNTLYGAILALAAHQEAGNTHIPPYRMTCLKLISELRATDATSSRPLITLTGVVARKKVVEHVLNLGVDGPPSFAPGTALIMSVSKQFTGTLVPFLYSEWALDMHMEVRDTGLGRAFSHSTVGINAVPAYGRTPRGIVTLIDKAPLAQVYHVIGTVEDMWWFPKVRNG